MADNKMERDMTGVLFVNDKKETDNHPDYTGRVLINGTKFSVSAWKKVSAAGKDYISLALRPWVERAEKDAGEVKSSSLFD